MTGSSSKQDDFSFQGAGELQNESILLRSILSLVLVFFPQFVCAGSLKPPFRLLWERKQTLTQFCNNKCIQASEYGFDVIDPLTGRGYCISPLRIASCRLQSTPCRFSE